MLLLRKARCLLPGQANHSQAAGVLHIEIEPDGLLLSRLQVQFPLQDAQLGLLGWFGLGHVQPDLDLLVPGYGYLIGDDHFLPPIPQVLHLDAVGVVQAALVSDEFLVHFAGHQFPRDLDALIYSKKGFALLYTIDKCLSSSLPVFY